MEYAPLIVVIILMIGFIAGGVGLPFFLFQRNRDDARAWNEVIQAYTGLRTQLIKENVRLAAMVDELVKDVDALGDKLDNERSQRLAMEERFDIETSNHRDCIREISVLRTQLEDHRLVINGWLAGYEIIRRDYEAMEKKPPWAPAGPLLPGDGD